jgi:hypothetical protein
MMCFLELKSGMLIFLEINVPPKHKLGLILMPINGPLNDHL